MNSHAEHAPNDQRAPSLPIQAPIGHAALGLAEPTIPCASCWPIAALACDDTEHMPFVRRETAESDTTAPLHPIEVAFLRDACLAPKNAHAPLSRSGLSLDLPADVTRECSIAAITAQGSSPTLPSARTFAPPAPAVRLEELFDRIAEAADEVHAVLGPGMLEATYARCLAFELGQRGLGAEPHAALPIRYKGQHVPFAARLSVVVEHRVAVQIESADTVQAPHEYRVRRLLDLAGLEGAIVLSFHRASMHGAVRRVVREPVSCGHARRGPGHGASHA